MCSVTSVARSAGSVAVRVKVTNSGSRDASAVVPVYVSQPESSVLVPAKRLAGFKRVRVDAGTSRTVTVTVARSALKIVQGDVDAIGPPTLEHGTYVFSTGAVTDTVTADATNSLTL